jgi:hypothetical protein
MIIEQLTHLFAPWNKLYGGSKVIPALTEGAHILSLLFGGGLAVAADRATLRARRRGDAARASQLSELHDVHRPVMFALCGSFLSGVALAGADVEVFAASPAFWVKLGLVTLLLLNGALLYRTESMLRGPAGQTPDRAERLWNRLRLSSILSLFLWSATLIAGTVLVNVA